MNIIIAFIASAAFVGSAYAVCDNTTSAKIEACVFKSDLMNPANLPKDEAGIDSYCNSNATNNCLATTMGDCNANERQMDLMKSLVTPKSIMDHQMYLCDNKTAVLEGNYDCLTDFQGQVFQDCLKTAVGMRTDADPTDSLKTNLDDMCKFFDAYAMCFKGEGISDNCKMFAEEAFMMAINGIRYDYCGMDDAGKKSVVDTYDVSSTSVLAASLVTVFSAYIISILN